MWRGNGAVFARAIRAGAGVAVYAIGCVLFLAQRRQRGREDASKSLFVYAIALMVLGFAALGAGLFALEVGNITPSADDGLKLNQMTILPAGAA
jgi:cytochrome bd-type quinol oxidase subunit 1